MEANSVPAKKFKRLITHLKEVYSEGIFITFLNMYNKVSEQITIIILMEPLDIFFFASYLRCYDRLCFLLHI